MQLIPLWLIIDPRWVRGCCLDRLAAWGKKIGSNRVVFLPFSAPPDILLTLPRIIVGSISIPENLPALIQARSPGRRAEAAWAARDRIFGKACHPPEIEAFVKHAVDHAHEGNTVQEVARTLGISERRLHRISIASIGFPPGTVLDLARIISVAADLRRERSGLESIAHTHTFPHAAAMSRLFLRFTGLRPGAFREHIQRISMSENGILLAETGSGSSESL